MDLAEMIADTSPYGVRWSIDVRRLGGDEHWSHHPDQLLGTASVAKVFALVEAAAQISDGTLDPGELLDRRSVESVADSGLWQHLTVDRLPVADVAALVGAVSDNWATNVLVDRLGLDAVQQRAIDVAAGGSMLLDLVRSTRGPDDAPQLSVGCAADWTGLFAELAAGRVVSPEVSETVLRWLAYGADLSMVAAAFDLDPLSHGVDTGAAVRLWHKTGTDDGIRADVGLVEVSQQSWTYAAICNWTTREPAATAAVLTAMRRIGDLLRGFAVHPRT